MLYGLPPLIQNRTIGMHVLFEHGDGALITLPNANDITDVHCHRMLYTDSGHYSLPTDNPEAQCKEEPHIALTCADALKRVADSLEMLAEKLLHETQVGCAECSSECNEHSDTLKIPPELIGELQ